MSRDIIAQLQPLEERYGGLERRVQDLDRLLTEWNAYFGPESAWADRVGRPRLGLITLKGLGSQRPRYSWR
jgi:hypothetical protein